TPEGLGGGLRPGTRALERGLEGLPALVAEACAARVQRPAGGAGHLRRECVPAAAAELGAGAVGRAALRALGGIRCRRHRLRLVQEAGRHRSDPDEPRSDVGTDYGPELGDELGGTPEDLLEPLDEGPRLLRRLGVLDEPCVCAAGGEPSRELDQVLLAALESAHPLDALEL